MDPQDYYTTSAVQVEVDHGTDGQQQAREGHESLPQATEGEVRGITQPRRQPDPRWHFTVLTPKTEETDRRPLIAHPSNLSNPSVEELRLSQMIWNGMTNVTWDQLQGAIDRGHHVGLFPAPSGAVVLDCDVKYYERLTGIVVPPELARMTPGIFEERRGIDQLSSVIRHLEIPAAEAATFTIKTKSDGRHVIYGENPRWPQFTTGHRDNWIVDVIAHNRETDRSWIATVPSPGYEILDDRPPVMLPDRLGYWLTYELPKLDPVGGKRRQRLNAARAEAMGSAMNQYGAITRGLDEDLSLIDRYVAIVVELVRDANKFGEWNKQLYRSGKDLFTIDLTYDEGLARLLQAAEPWNDHEARRATTTIKSAWRAVQREKGFRR